ncbi:hypothetical protein NC651_037232 [Populus alba x Populus x berolinensis]|nr:hypothetical protein NC651_037232 [Populus alba x Populus x berolinensis]
MDFWEIDILVLQEPQLNEMDFLEIDLLGPQPIFSETVQPVENLQFGVGGFSQLDQGYYIVVVGSDTMEDGNMQEQVNRNLSEDKSCMPSSKQEVCLSFLPSS